MMLWRVLTVATLLATAAAVEAPACSTQCTVAGLTAAQCPLSDIQTCLCRNTTLLRSVSLCVQSACNVTEQMTSASILQDDLCEGVPQPSRSHAIVRDTIILTAFAYFLFILRCISRHMDARGLWWDDWFLIAAVICTVPLSAIPIFNAYKGFGKHFWDVPPQNIRILRMLYYVSEMFYGVVQPITKISILLLYYRIFPNKKFRLATIISLIWMTGHFIGFQFGIAFQCFPVNSIWDPAVKGKCTNFTATVYAGAGLSIFEDLVIIALPIFVLKDLSLAMKKKTVLIFVFALGSFACITSMIRLKYIIYSADSQDLTWDNVDLVIWSVIELYTAIMCASLFSIRPLMVKLFPKLFPESRATGSKSQNTNNSATWPTKVGARMASRIRSGSSTVLVNDETDDVNGELALKNPAHVYSEIELSERKLTPADAHLWLRDVS